VRFSAGILDAVVESSLERWNVPGAAVGVLAGGAPDVRAYGVADLRTGEPLDSGATLRIASLTKPFTAALALSLADEGLLDLDRPVPVARAGEEITPRRLLAHVAGLECELGDLARFGSGDDALGRAVAETRTLGRLTAPGRWWSYANTGYWIVGALCGEVLGTTYEEALRGRVLEPLGLERTPWGEPEVTGHVERVPGSGEHEPAPERPYPRARRPSGGLVSTADELLRFARAHLAGESSFRLTAPEVPTPRGAYALGWAVTRHGGDRVWSHDGSYGGFQSRLAVLPERDAAFVILTNGDAGAAVVREVSDRLLESFAYAVEQPPTVAVTGQALDKLAGRYAGPELEVDVERSEVGLRLGAVEIDAATGARARQPPIEARPLGDRRFAVVGGVDDGVPFDFLPEAGPPRFLRIASRLVPRA
jgi:CubicO group peptidase (beta-lactamase class C family)